MWWVILRLINGVSKRLISGAKRAMGRGGDDCHGGALALSRPVMVKLSSDVGRSPADELAGRKILLTGTTGFVGKVALSMLLTHYPSIGRVYALIRPGIQTRSEERFANSVLRQQR